MAVERFIDLQVREDDEGIFDLVLDGDDFAIEEGVETALIVSLFSDRRAASDEVSDPLKRRGWIGNQVAEVPGDNFGSGLWLYDQSRLDPQSANGLRLEAMQALEWMIDEGLATDVEAAVEAVQGRRTTILAVDLGQTSGNPLSKAYRLADSTQRGLLGSIR